MRIGFDTSALVRPHPPGIVRLVACAMAALERTAGITALRLEPGPNENLILWRQVRLPQLLRERELIGVHSFVSAFALAGPGKRVQTIHELPWRHGVRENAGLRHRFWARIASRRADLVLCGTDFVARELRRGPAAARVRLCPWGVDSAQFRIAGASTAIAAWRAEQGLGETAAAAAPAVILAPGAVRPKKNLAALLRGIAERKRRGAPSVVVAVSGEVGADAKRDQALARELGIEQEVRWLGVLDETQLVQWVSAADGISVLSHSEGFGLPVLEAFAAGRGVLVSKDSAQAEVAAGLGIEVDPLDPASVADGIEGLLRDRRGAERQAHAAHFSWERCAARIADLWREIA